MTNEFLTWCNLYYQLTMLHSEQEEQFKTLLDNAPLYRGQTNVGEVDAIISNYRGVQAEKAKMDKTTDDLRKTAHTILVIMQHFEIPPGTVFTGEIPGEMEFTLWADENDKVYINKIEDLAPEEDNRNIMVIECSGGDVGWD